MKGGLNGNLFDNQVDGIGELTKRLAVYNLSGVKDKPQLAQLVMNEIFYRVIRLFEDKANRSVPKLLEIDEAQYIFSIPGAIELIEAKCRTWFKHNGGMGFWTQSPEHYSNIEGWATLRASASAWWFLADQQMDRKKYKHAFDLTDGECDAIEQLIPRQQAFIIQREAGIAKTVNIITSKQEHVIATSRPHETLIVQEELSKHQNIDIAVAEMVKRIFPED
ncbi:AAA-like domain protein [compost metagenome]